MRRLLRTDTVALLLGIALGGVLSAQTPLTPFANLLLKADATGALSAVQIGDCGTLGPLTNGANVRVTSDSSGALRICGGGTPSFTSLTLETLLVDSAGAGTYLGLPAIAVLDTDGAVTWHLIFRDDSDTLPIGIGNDGGTLYISSDGTLFDTWTPTAHIVLSSAARGTGNVVGRRILLGRNNSGNGAAGHVALVALDGTVYYLWVDATGDLRVGTAPPDEDGTPADTSGTIVGTQS